MNERQLAHIAARTRIVRLRTNESLPFEDLEEDEDYPFFVVYTGKLRLSPPRWKSKTAEILRQDDFFGADTLFFGARPHYQVIALTSSVLLRIESEVLASLLDEIPRLKDNIKKVVDIYRQIHGRHFEWLGEGEVVQLIARKHPAYLLVSLVLPVLLGWLAVLIFVSGSFIAASSFQAVTVWISSLVLIAAAVWGLWVYIDWRNDYYIISDRRVVWLEHVVGLYDSRQEAPLTAIKAEEVQSTLLGRYLGYADVEVHTLMGKITFRDIGQPQKIKEMIIEQQKLALEREYQADIQAMEELIRGRISDG
ncbi:MAG: cyclic nucleotide-binding domain-containing protein [Anaerolineales bacterium]